MFDFSVGSVDQLRDFIENSGDLIQLVSMDGRVLFANRAWRETLGYTKEEIDQLSIFSVLASDCHEHCTGILQRVAKGEDVGLVKTAMLARNGRRVEVEGRINLYRQDGRPLSTHGVFRDVTLQRQQEAELRMLALVAARTHNGVLITDRCGRTTWVNEAHALLTGHTLEEMKGLKPGAVLQGPKSDPATIERMGTCIREGRGFVEEIVNYHKNGQPFWMLIEVQPLVDERGECTGFMSIQQNVTAQREQAQELERRVSARTEELVRTQNQFQSLFEHAPDAMVMVDARGLIQLVNLQAERTFGSTRQELVGSHIQTLIPGELRQRHEELRSTFSQDLDRKEAQHLARALPALRRDGSTFPADISLNPIETPQGRVTVAAIRDVTELHDREERLRASERKLKDAQRIAHMGSWELDIPRNRLSWSEEMFRIFEVDPQRFQASYEGFLAVVHPEDREAVDLAYKQSIATKSPYEISHRLLLPGGRVRIVHERFATTFGPDGSPLRSLGTVQDITELKTVERKLHETSGLLEQITENIQEAIWLFDNREQRLLYVSKGYELVWGRTVESLYANNRQFLEAVVEDDRHLLLEAMGRQARGDRTETEYRVLRPDGTTRWILDRSFPVLAPDGTVARTTGIAQDITERKLAEQAVEANRLRLQRIIERAPVPMAYSDKAGRILLRNERYMKLIGYSPGQVPTVEAWWERAYPDLAYRNEVRQRWAEAVARAAQGQEAISSMTCRIHCEDGESRTFDIAGIELDDGMLVVFVDLTARVAAEEELRKFRTIADQSPYGIAMTTVSGELVYMNAAWQAMCGWTEDEIRGRPIAILHHERDLPHVQQLFGKLVREGCLLDEEVFHRRRNGERYPTMMNAVIIRDEAQRPIFTTATCTDITERVLGRTLLKIQNDVLSKLGEGRPLDDVLGLLCQGAEAWLDGARCYALEFLSDGTWRLAGRTQSAESGPPGFGDGSAETPGVNAFSPRFVEPFTVRDLSSDPSLPASVIRSLSALGLIALWSHPAREGDRTLGAFVVAVPVAGDPNPHQRRLLEDCARLVATAVNRHRVQQALEESEAYFRSLADSGTALIWTAGTNKKCNYFNQTWLKFTGRTLEQELGDGWADGVHPDDLASCFEKYTAAFDRREPFLLRYRLRRHDGEYREIDDHGTPRYSHKGEFAGYIGHCFDVTERLLAERLASRSQRLEAIGQLAGGVAHDLNNALSPILLSTGGLAIECPGAKETIETIEVSARRCADMVKQLLTFARGADGQKFTMHPRYVIKEIEKILRGTFPKNIEIRVHTLRDPELIIADPTQVHQVLLNLCVNARDAMPDGGVLTLRSEAVEIDDTFSKLAGEARPGRYVMMEVEDTGIGIPPQIIDRIFDPFFTTKGPDKGTGLGLSTVLGIAKGHGGFVRVYSQRGKGSTFRAYFPATDDHVMDPSAVNPVGQIIEGKGRVVLVVDDEVGVRRAMGAALEDAGFSTLNAKDGTDGLIAVANHHKALSCVISDVHMPNMNGLQFMQMVRRMLPGLPIIAASGRLDKADEEELHRLGVAVILPKPFSQHTLLTALRSALRDCEMDPQI